REVVGHRVDQLAHEPRREHHARNDDTGYLALLDLVVDTREGNRELVVGMADVREVRIDPGHRLRSRLDVEMTLARVVGHRRSIAAFPAWRLETLGRPHTATPSGLAYTIGADFRRLA